jgi:hypothetical protein
VHRLWGIAGNLVSQGMFYDLAVRDIEIAVGAYALAQLTAVRELRTASNAIAVIIGSPASLTQ